MSILCSISQSNPRGAAHACSGNSFRGGVYPRVTRRPKGQSTIEYVLIIAIIVLVVLIAGPWVSSAIRNQFNTVAGTLGNGIQKGSWENSGTGGGNGSLTDADIVDPVHGTAFAVYSQDDHSLMFYKRKGLPKVGDMLNSRRVTEVYTGFEKGNETAVADSNDGQTTAPWWSIRNEIINVSVVDNGIKVKSMSFWFQFLENCKTFDLDKLDMSQCNSLKHAFTYCRNATSLGVSTWDTSSVENFDSALRDLTKIEAIDISGWSSAKAYSFHIMFMANYSMKTLKLGPGWSTSQVNLMYGMFWGCRALTLDCSEWQVKTDATHERFNSGAVGVTLPKAWQ